MREFYCEDCQDWHEDTTPDFQAAAKARRAAVVFGTAAVMAVQRGNGNRARSFATRAAKYAKAARLAMGGTYD